MPGTVGRPGRDGGRYAALTGTSSPCSVVDTACNDAGPMENKALTPPAASALARLKLKTVKPKPRVPIEDAKTSDSRRSRRQSACVQGTVLSERLSEPVACVIRNLSATAGLAYAVGAGDGTCHIWKSGRGASALQESARVEAEPSADPQQPCLVVCPAG